MFAGLTIARGGLRKFGLALAASTVLALGALSPMQAAAQETVLKFVSWQNDEPGVGGWWASVIEEYKAQHPGVEIEWTKVERAAFADTMTTLFAGGSPPDIVHLASFEFQRFAKEGWLENLAPWVEKSGTSLDGWAGQKTCELDNETVCVMMLYFGYIMAYNEAILTAEGLAPPTNYAELLEVARKTTKDLNGDGIIDQFGLHHPTKVGGGQYVTEMLNYVLDAGGRWTNAEGQVTINTPEVIEGLTRWKTVVTEGLMPRDLSSGETRQLLADGKIAVGLDGPWLVPIIAKGAAAADVKIVADPLSPPVGGSSNVLGMSKDISDEHKALVWDFIALAMSDTFQSSYATLAASPAPSPRADIAEATAVTPEFGLLVDAAKAASAAGIDRIPAGLEVQYNEFAKMVMEESQRMIIENLDPAAVAATMQARAEELQNQ
ncbi:ABC transporter substrate-binding protein [Devosia sp. A449]